MKSVHVDVDEAGRHVAVARIDDRCPRRFYRTPFDGNDAAAVNDQRARGDDSPGQNQVASADDDHGAILSPSQSMCT